MYALHHVSITTRDLARSAAFYREALGLEQIRRPPFSTQGVWFGLGALSLHITLHPEGTLRSNSTVDNADGHFAIQVSDFDATLAKLSHYGFREDAPQGDALHLSVFRNSVAGFPQAYFIDPDRNVIEINAAPS